MEKRKVQNVRSKYVCPFSGFPVMGHGHYYNNGEDDTGLSSGGGGGGSRDAITWRWLSPSL